MFTDDYLYYNEIRMDLEEMFKYNPEYYIAESTFRNTYQDVFDTRIEFNRDSRKFLSNRVKLTEYCKIKIFISQNVLMFYLWIIIVLVLGYLLVIEIRNKKNCQIAENLYKCIVLDIQNNTKVRIVT